MTKEELIKSLEFFNDDDVVILGHSTTGWSNVDEVVQDGSCIAITMGDHPENRTRK